MQTREIPEAQWEPFCKEFSEAHRGDRITLEIFGPEVGTQRGAEMQPLVGITLDTKGSRRGSIAVMCGDSPSVNIVHSVASPDHVRVAQTDDGLTQALEIESAADGNKTIVWFGPAEFPSDAAAASN